MLRVAVKRRMISDVPVGVLLSGGVDSSLIVGLLAEAGQSGLMSFSVGFEEANGEKGDEFVYSDLIAKHFGTEHHKIFVPSANLMDALPGTIAAMSEPMVSYDNVGFYLLSKEVSKHIKVVQSGQGLMKSLAAIIGIRHWSIPTMLSAIMPRDFVTARTTCLPRNYRRNGCRNAITVRSFWKSTCCRTVRIHRSIVHCGSTRM